MKVWYHPESPYAQRVLYFLDALQIQTERIPVSLENREHRDVKFLSINQFGRVPVIDDGGFRLSESLAILRYLAARQGLGEPSAEGWYPVPVKERAAVDQWLEYVAHHACRPFLDLAWARTLAGKYRQIVEPMVETMAVKKLKRELPVLECRLAVSSFLCGATPTLADVALFPFVALWRSAKLNLHEDHKKLKNLAAWLSRMESERSNRK